MIKLFYDLETTGVDVRKHGIHQLAGIIEIDDQVVASFDIRARPNPKAIIDDESLQISGATKEQIMSYQEMGLAYKEFINIFNRYVDKYSKTDKIFLVGYNNIYFDDTFLRAGFEQNGDQFFSAYFWKASLDVSALAAEYLLNRRADMPSFKLKRVCSELGIEVDETKLHNSVYDCQLLRQVYRIVTKREIEL